MGKLSREELQILLSKPRIRAYFDVCGIDFKDSDFFFKLLTTAQDDIEDDCIDVDQFITSCMRLKGFATSIDLQTLRFETHDLVTFQNTFFKYCEEQFSAIEASLFILREHHAPS